jgi:hypothetical protein
MTAGREVRIIFEIVAEESAESSQLIVAIEEERGRLGMREGGYLACCDSIDCNLSKYVGRDVERELNKEGKNNWRANIRKKKRAGMEKNEKEDFFLDFLANRGGAGGLVAGGGAGEVGLDFLEFTLAICQGCTHLLFDQSHFSFCRLKI